MLTPNGHLKIDFISVVLNIKIIYGIVIKMKIKKRNLDLQGENLYTLLINIII